MIRIALLLLLCTSASSALADPTCTSRAADKKLAGAALTSFMTKCQNDASKSCADQAAAKKLAGAAKTSFMKKCEAGG